MNINKCTRHVRTKVLEKFKAMLRYKAILGGKSLRGVETLEELQRFRTQIGKSVDRVRVNNF